MTKTKTTPKTLDQAFEGVSTELLEMFLQKHADYGKGNILSGKELGIAFRINEKAERLKNLLMSGNTPENESVEETFVDIAVYAVIGVLYRREQFQKLDVEEKKK
jgi:hypothetical protein